MPYASFVKLCGLVEPFVSIDPKMSRVRNRREKSYNSGNNSALPSEVAGWWFLP
jgi:hypothetical protein